MNKVMKRAIFLYFLLSNVVLSFAQVAGTDGIVGTWRSPSGDVLIRIDKVGGQFQGRIVWLKADHTGELVLDEKNPDQLRRRMPLKGNKIICDLSYDPDESQWEGGTFYCFKEGKTYKCCIRMAANDQIKVIRYSGSPDKGISEIWSRH